MSVTSLAFGLVEVVPLLVLARFVGGFGSSLSWVAAFTWLTARAPDERRGELVGVQVSAAALGDPVRPLPRRRAPPGGLVPALAAVAPPGGGVPAWAAVEGAPGAA